MHPICKKINLCCFVLIFLIGKQTSIAANGFQFTYDNPISLSAESAEEQVVALINQERASIGLSPLSLDQALSQVARVKSEDMRDNQYFSHTSPVFGSTFEIMKGQSIQYYCAAENLAAGQVCAEEVVTDWMNSETHRQNIMNPEFTHIGIGIADGTTPYWTQLFIG